MKNRDWIEAANLYRQVLDVKPKYADVWVKFGQALDANRRLRAAISSFSEAVAINPKYAVAWGSWASPLERSVRRSRRSPRSGAPWKSTPMSRLLPTSFPDAR